MCIQIKILYADLYMWSEKNYSVCVRIKDDKDLLMKFFYWTYGVHEWDVTNVDEGCLKIV